MEIQDRYLGDGVYANFDGYQIWLKTLSGDAIALEPDVFFNLIQYQEYIRDAMIAAQGTGKFD